jgi:hypothetical protein
LTLFKKAHSSWQNNGDAATLAAQDPRRHKRIAAVLADFKQLSDEG